MAARAAISLDSKTLPQLRKKEQSLPQIVDHTHWEALGVQGLYDQPRSGRPSKLTPEERELAKQYLKEEPRSLKAVVDRLEKKTQKRISLSA